MPWVTIANVRGPRGYTGQGVTESLRLRPLSDLPSLNVEDWIGMDLIGIYAVTGTASTIIGRPLGVDGFAFIVIEPLASGGSLVKWVEYNAPRRTFEKIISNSVGNRTGWKRTDAATRTVLHQLSMPSNSSITDLPPSRHVRLPVKFFVNVDTWELVLKNFNDQSRTNFGELSFYEVFISKRKREADGEYGPNFETAPVSLGTPVATGQAGTASHRYLLTGINYPLEANTEYILSYAYDTPDSTPNHKGIGGSYLGTNTAGRNSMDVTNTWSPYTPLDVYIKPDISPNTAFNIYPGSSSETGLQSDYPLRDCWSWRHAEAHGAVPAQLGMSGSTLSSWNAGGHYMWTKLSAVAPADKVVGNPGSNDLYIGATLAEMQARFIEFARLVRTYGGAAFEAADVFPRATETASVKSVRLAFNAWLRTLPANILRVHDRASSVSGPDGLLRADFNSGDNTHLNTAGQHHMAASMISGLPKPDVVNSYRFAESAGRTMWAWDYLNGREQLIYGDTGNRDITPAGSLAGYIQIHRKGTGVWFRVFGVVFDGSGNLSVPGIIPLGFKPTTLQYINSVAYWDSEVDFRARISGDTLQIRGYTAGTPTSFIGYWDTADSWPASLPGTAVGTIPYQ